MQNPFFSGITEGIDDIASARQMADVIAARLIDGRKVGEDCPLHGKPVIKVAPCYLANRYL